MNKLQAGRAPSARKTSPLTLAAVALALVAGALLMPSSAFSWSNNREPGGKVLSDWEAASLVWYTNWEPRRQNWGPNHRTPSDWELRDFFNNNQWWGDCGERLKRNVTGNFTGSTNEIIQWAAYKWGIDEDILRSVAVVESWWRQGTAADWDHNGNPDSWGLMQIRRSVHRGTYPLTSYSTAFAVDYYGFILRYYYDGCAGWLNEVDRGWNYGAGDMWGAVGVHYSGRWHTWAAHSYTDYVQRVYNEKTWERFGQE